MDRFCLLGKTCETRSSKHFLWTQTTRLSFHLLSATAVDSRRWYQLLSFLLQSSFGCWDIFQDWAPEGGYRREETRVQTDRHAFEKAASPRPGALGFRSRPWLVSPETVLWLSHSMTATSSAQMKAPRGAFRWVAGATHLFSSAHSPLPGRMSRREKYIGGEKEGDPLLEVFFFFSSLDFLVCKVLITLFITSTIRRVNKNNVCNKSLPRLWPTEDTKSTSMNLNLTLGASTKPRLWWEMGSSRASWAVYRHLQMHQFQQPHVWSCASAGHPYWIRRASY